MTEQIRALIERWATAVQSGDLEGVLADHADDIQMFDVPPPNEVRGINAYRETWPPFFGWLERGNGAFEIVDVEDHVVEQLLRNLTIAPRVRALHH